MSSILVIDDKDSMRKMVSQTLAEEGYTVDTAADGAEGIAEHMNIRAAHVHVVLDVALAHQLPGAEQV